MADTSVPYFENPAFKKSFADVPIDPENKISTEEFIQACQSLVLIFDYLKAAAFSPVKSDISGNVTVCPYLALPGLSPISFPLILTGIFHLPVENRDSLQRSSRRVRHPARPRQE